MASKYAKVLAGLPKTFGGGEDAESNQEKVETTKSAIVADYAEEHNGARPPASYLAREWADLRIAKDDLEDQLKAVNVQISAYTQLMIAQYEQEGIEKLHLDTGEAPRVQIEPYFSVEDPDAFRTWCIKNGYARLLTLPWNTRVTIGKELLLNGEPLPPGLKAWCREKIVKR